jgi:hypothetical protein
MKTLQFLQFLNECVHSSQSELAEYSFLSSNKHREVKDILSKINVEQDAGENLEYSNLIKLADNIKSLEEYLYFGLEKVFKKNHEHINKYFSQRSKIEMRGCLKLIAGNQLITLFRQPDEELISEISVKPDDNTAFETIVQGNPFYLCNDIPSAVESNDYNNTRINRKLVLEYNIARNSKFDQQNNDDENLIWNGLNAGTKLNYLRRIKKFLSRQQSHAINQLLLFPYPCAPKD